MAVNKYSNKFLISNIDLKIDSNRNTKKAELYY